MGKLVVSEFVTVDGVFEDPGGSEQTEHGGWAFRFERGPEGDKFKNDELEAAEVLLLGRTTYDGFAEAWPKMEGMNEFAEKMNSMPKFVVSGTLESADWNNSTVIPPGDFGARVTELKRETEGDVLIAGSGQLVRGLGELGLVDEYRLMVYPILLGSGRRLFDGPTAPRALRLVDSRPAGETMILTYQPR